jgi:hypothetical protein
MDQTTRTRTNGGTLKLLQVKSQTMSGEDGNVILTWEFEDYEEVLVTTFEKLYTTLHIYTFHGDGFYIKDRIYTKLVYTVELIECCVCRVPDDCEWICERCQHRLQEEIQIFDGKIHD